MRSEHAALGKASSARGLLWVDLSEKLQAQKRSCSFLREIGINNEISSRIGRAGWWSHKTYQKRHQLTPKLITLVLALPWDFPLTSLFHTLWEERLYFSSCCRWQCITVGKSQWPELETADCITVTVKSGEKWTHTCLLVLDSFSALIQSNSPCLGDGDALSGLDHLTSLPREWWCL